jgi:hypothetical protein
MVAFHRCVDQGDLLGINDSQIVNHVGAHDRVAKKGTKTPCWTKAIHVGDIKSCEGFHALTAAGKRSHARATGVDGSDSSMDPRYGQEAQATFGTERIRR